MSRIRFKTIYAICLLLTLVHPKVYRAAKEIVYADSESLMDISSLINVYEDTSATMDFARIVSQNFKATNQTVFNPGLSKSNFWVKIPLRNNTNVVNLMLELALPTLDEVMLYNSKGKLIYKSGERYPFAQRNYESPNYYIDVSIPAGTTQEYYMKISNTDVIQLPLQLGSKHKMNQRINQNTLNFGLYTGLMLLAIFYNLFVYFSVKDRSYIYYVVYIVLVLLTQIALQGFAYQYLWPNNPDIAQMSNFFLPVLVGIAGMEFMKEFLNVKSYSRVLFYSSFCLTLSYLVALTLSYFEFFIIGLKMIEITAILVSFYMLGTSIYIMRKGSQPAKYFTIAWSFFLLGVIAYVLKDVGVLPHNNFTRYTMQIGSGVETILLSFALAARINIYKKERLEAVQEKEMLLKEQNIILEQKVDERTKELNKALTKLKNAQVQLVDAEKMSSLGQLTAGIAHEINNPINFVSSNIGPLRQDLDEIKKIISQYEQITDENVKEKLIEIQALKATYDYDYLKEELDSIIDGIEDGAIRTKEIISGLRNFSRLDEGELKLVDINLGIESTLTLLKSKLASIQVQTKLTKDALCECNPGNINQVIMNLLDNAIDAIQEKYENLEQGVIGIETQNKGEYLQISVSDNGIGITDELITKIFDPFYTSKEVGAGSGLGLSIVRGILEKHHALFEVDSSPSGTKFIIQLPKINHHGND